MPLRRLCKASNSGENGQCPALYVADDPAWMVEGPDVLAKHLRWRDVALAQAVPLHDYHRLDMIEV